MLVRRSNAIVHHLLEHPQLLSSVRRLAPVALKRLVDHVGLEDAGDLLAFASTEQLEAVFDTDLWRSERPGEDETFDADRFALWLEVLVAQGERLAAKKVAELDEDLVVLALCKHLLVIDVEQLARSISEQDPDDIEQLEKQLESGLYHEFEQWRVIARDHASWDAIFTILVELNESDFETFERLMQRACDATSRYVEESGGLYDVLSNEQSLEADVTGARQDRREEAGYVAPSAAIAFLKLSRDTAFGELLGAKTRDPLTLAYFRNVRGPESHAEASSAKLLTAQTEDGQASLSTLLQTLREAEVLADESAPRLPQSHAHAPGRLAIVRALSQLGANDARTYDLRMQEAAYLANVLLSAVGTRDRRLTPTEAAEAALAVANLGAQHAERFETGRALGETAILAQALTTRSLVTYFQLGFHRLCQSAAFKSARATRELMPLRQLLAIQGLIGN